jgi:hypothetical protein
LNDALKVVASDISKFSGYLPELLGGSSGKTDGAFPNCLIIFLGFYIPPEIMAPF